MSTPASTCWRTIAAGGRQLFEPSAASAAWPWLINCTISAGRGSVPACDTRMRSVLRLIAPLLYSDSKERRFMAITKLGHVGIYANDLANMRDFYSRVVGLQVADEAPNAVFMSSEPRSASTTSSSSSNRAVQSSRPASSRSHSAARTSKTSFSTTTASRTTASGFAV